MTLDDAIAALRSVLSGLSDELRQIVLNYLAEASGQSPADVVDALKFDLALVIGTFADTAADYSVQWYNDIAPEEPYRPELPPGKIIAVERIQRSIEWAVNTGAKGATFDDAVTKLIGANLTGATDRVVYDASRVVVEHNAVKEKVRYARVARAGACEWCRLMAIRGAVFTSASRAIKGHDSCHCIALPVRGGMTFEPPAHYAAWEKQYTAATKSLRDAEEPVNLNTALRELARQSKGSTSGSTNRASMSPKSYTRSILATSPAR